MKPLMAGMLGSLLFAANVLADDLTDEIKAWTPGKEVPHRLLSYPDGDVESRDPGCYFSTRDSYLAAYIENITNDALLEEIVFDSRVESSPFRHALVRLIERRGLHWFSSTLSKRQSGPWELEALRQLLRTRHVKVSVATIEPGKMARNDASRVLGGLKARLDSGMPWLEAYRAVADEHPDIERRKQDPRFETTLVQFLFEGWLSAGGFSFSELGVNRYLPQQHIQRLVSSDKGAQIIDTGDQIYVYYVSDVFEPVD